MIPRRLCPAGLAECSPRSRTTSLAVGRATSILRTCLRHTRHVAQLLRAYWYHFRSGLPVFQGLPAYTVCVLPGMVSADHPTLVCYHSSQTHTATVWVLIRPRVSPVIAVIVVTAIAEVNPLCIVMLSCFVFVVNPCLCEPYIFPFVPAFVRHAAGSLRFTISPLIHDPMLVYCHPIFHHTDDFVKLPSHGFNCLPSMLHPFRFRHRIIHVLR